LLAPRNRALLAVGAGAFVIGAIANAPAEIAANLAADAAPLLEIGGTSGTLWRGELTDVSYDGIALGRISFRLEPIGLLTGKVVARVTSSGGALAAKGRVTMSPTSIDLHDAGGEFNLSAIRRYTFFGARYRGSANFSAGRLQLSKAGCRAENARVSTNALETLTSQWRSDALPLAGDIQCVDGKLKVVLTGENRDGLARLEAFVAPDFSYTMTFTASPRRADISDALRLFGFEGDNANLSYRAAGRLKGLTS
jgi:hypothetical protein